MTSPPAIDADAAASALVEAWKDLCDAHPRGWAHPEPDGLGAASGVPVPTLNGVWAHGAEPRTGTIADLLDEVAASELPHCLQTRPGSSEALGALARERGMERAEDDMPLMVLDEPPAGAERPPELTIRQISPADAEIHTGLLAAGFGAPQEIFAELMAPEVLGLAGSRCYVGEVDGEAVVTGLGVSARGSVGIFNVATAPEAQRKGYGAALTARAVEDGFDAGCTFAYLQSSLSAYGVYERLGFRLIERWDLWVAPAGAN